MESNSLEGLTFKVKVVPNAKKRRCVLDAAGSLKCYLTSAPEKGRANKELLGFIAKTLNIAQYQVTLVRGETSRYKTVHIQAAVTMEQVLKAFGLAQQQSCIEP